MAVFSINPSRCCDLGQTLAATCFSEGRCLSACLLHKEEVPLVISYQRSLERDISMWEEGRSSAGKKISSPTLSFFHCRLLQNVGKIFFICGIQLMVCTGVMWPAASQTECQISLESYSFGHWIKPHLVQLLLGHTTGWKNFPAKHSINSIAVAFPVNNTVIWGRECFLWAGCGPCVSYFCNSLSSLFLFHVLASGTLLSIDWFLFFVLLTPLAAEWSWRKSRLLSST